MLALQSATRVASRRISQKQGVRSIAIGTDMVSSVISLQKARPWYMCAEEGSNKAADNAVTLRELFGRDKTVAMFGVPAPFTGTCTRKCFWWTDRLLH